MLIFSMDVVLTAKIFTFIFHGFINRNMNPAFCATDHILRFLFHKRHWFFLLNRVVDTQSNPYNNKQYDKFDDHR